MVIETSAGTPNTGDRRGYFYVVIAYRTNPFLKA